MKTYYQNDDGELTSQEKREKDKYNYAVFHYLEGEDIERIEGEIPLMYKTIKELKRDIANMDEDFFRDGTVVIRNITIYV